MSRDSYDPVAFAEIFEKTKNAAYEIVKRKHSTYYAIGLGLKSIVRAILRDQKTILTVSVPLKDSYGVNGIALSLPAVIGKSGAEYLLDLPLDEIEIKAFQASAETLKQQYTKVMS